MPTASHGLAVDVDLLGELSRLGRELGEAADVAELERTYLDGVARVLPFRAHGVYVFEDGRHRPASLAARGVSDYFLSRYEDRGRFQDPVFETAVTSGEPALNRALMSEHAWRGLPVWDEVFALHDMTTLLQVPLIDGNHVVGTLNFGDREEPQYGRHGSLAIADSLGRIVGLSLASLRAYERTARQRHTLAAALDVCDRAVIVTDLASGDRHSNAAAREALERIDALAPAGWLEDLMAEARAVDSSVRTAEGQLTGPDGAALRVVVRTIVDPVDPSVIVSFLAVYEGTEDRTPELPGEVAAGLTARERDVVRLVVDGLHDHEIAERLVLSPHTVKGYLKQIYRKLGLDSRVGLVRVAFGVGGGRPPRRRMTTRRAGRSPVGARR
ncbi:hypothetical protein ER308_12895 [Egibacter rhizosphaerae]|uniref:HTH luxR-type domain-containing protein n=1 Tax=Egibacter rhizosphaerae TaxID=1670831 RepID=A0A411YGP3_9ACTN|nr:LuxR C-terminal-related transcriptional regulator [Egibacter rhizosphaerae]QBI20373.1 hypothetical protein ER308_12895 [Egibacter rhizosphaerae]